MSSEQLINIAKLLYHYSLYQTPVTLPAMKCKEFARVIELTKILRN